MMNSRRGTLYSKSSDYESQDEASDAFRDFEFDEEIYQSHLDKDGACHLKETKHAIQQQNEVRKLSEGSTEFFDSGLSDSARTSNSDISREYDTPIRRRLSNLDIYTQKNCRDEQHDSFKYEPHNYTDGNQSFLWSHESPSFVANPMSALTVDESKLAPHIKHMIQEDSKFPLPASLDYPLCMYRRVEDHGAINKRKFSKLIAFLKTKSHHFKRSKDTPSQPSYVRELLTRGENAIENEDELLKLARTPRNRKSNIFKQIINKARQKMPFSRGGMEILSAMSSDNRHNPSQNNYSRTRRTSIVSDQLDTHFSTDQRRYGSTSSLPCISRTRSSTTQQRRQSVHGFDVATNLLLMQAARLTNEAENALEQQRGRSAQISDIDVRERNGLYQCYIEKYDFGEWPQFSGDYTKQTNGIDPESPPANPRIPFTNTFDTRTISECTLNGDKRSDKNAGYGTRDHQYIAGTNKAVVRRNNKNFSDKKYRKDLLSSKAYCNCCCDCHSQRKECHTDVFAPEKIDCEDNDNQTLSYDMSEASLDYQLAKHSLHMSKVFEHISKKEEIAERQYDSADSEEETEVAPLKVEIVSDRKAETRRIPRIRYVY